jgi:DNA/RNA-binding domain of Phe-tRNA-synthetase-like protein
MTGEGAPQFRVEPAIFARFPGLRLAMVAAHGADNHTARPAVAESWCAAWADAARMAAGYGNAQSLPRVRPWREAFRAMGVSSKEFPSSIEAMLRRALKGGAPFEINPLVDFYNGVSLRHIVPVGGFDLDQLHGPLELRLTRDGDRFTALREEAPLAVPPGEVAYADRPTILTRHFVWRQARSGLITPSTRSVFLVSEVLGDVGGDVAEAVLDDLRTGLRAHFDATPCAFLLHERHADGSEK